MEARFTEALAVMDEVHRRVLTEDMPLAKLGPVVDAAVSALGLSPAREAAGDSLSGAALGWLAEQDRQEQRITWGGTALTLTLTVGAILASGGWLAEQGLGAAGAAVGFGEALCSAERAGDLHAAGGARGAGAPQAPVAAAESARVQSALAALAALSVARGEGGGEQEQGSDEGVFGGSHGQKASVLSRKWVYSPGE